MAIGIESTLVHAGAPKQAKAKPKREGTPRDFAVVARRVVEQAIGEHLDGSPLPEKN